jgi:hypothetical protein
MKLFLVISTFLSFESAFAFHEVTSVLSSGKLLICQDANQIKKGGVVEQYSAGDHPGRFKREYKKISEFQLPEIGRQLVLSRTSLINSGKMKKELIKEKIGTAIIVDASLENEERVEKVFTNTKFLKFEEKTLKISKQEEQEIKSKCIVAVPENGLKLNEHASVSWE